jgi:hypothetical protein
MNPNQNAYNIRFNLAKLGLNKQVWLFILVVISQTLVHAQTQTILKGRVLDATNDSPLPYATVSIPQSNVGVVTNDLGEFAFHIPSNYTDGIVEFSFIGYKKKSMRISGLKPEKVYTISLAPSVVGLNEVAVTAKKGTPASKIVTRAIKNIDKNYPIQPFLSYAYYRDYIKDINKNNLKNLVEAAVVINDMGFNKNDYDQSKIKLEQIRYNPSYASDTALNLAYDGKTKFVPHANIDKSNDLAILRLQDPIRNHNRKTFSFVYVFDLSFVPNHVFHYNNIIVNDSSKIYDISFATIRLLNDTSKYGYWASGNIYIDAKSYAILKFTYHVKCILPSYSGDYFDLKLEYKNINDKYYLNYLSLCNYFEYKPDATANAKPEQNLQYRELFVNKTDNAPIKRVLKAEAIRKDTLLISNQIPAIEGFWDNYNYIMTEPLME